MERVREELQPVEQPAVNRLVAGAMALKIERLEPIGDVEVETPSGRVPLAHAALAEVRGAGGHFTYLFGERRGRLVGAPSR